MCVLNFNFLSCLDSFVESSTIVSINPSKNNSERIMTLRNSVCNGISRNFTELRNFIPVELKKFRKIPPEFRCTESAEH